MSWRSQNIWILHFVNKLIYFLTKRGPNFKSWLIQGQNYRHSTPFVHVLNTFPTKKNINTVYLIFSLLPRLQGYLWAIQYLVRPLNLGHQNLHGFKNRIDRIEEIHQLHCDCFGIYQRRWWSQKSGSHSRYRTRCTRTSLFCESLGHVSRFYFGFMVIYHY